MNNIKYLKELPLSKKVLCLIMLVFGGIFYTTGIGNHYYFRTFTFDYGLYNFAFWDYAHFHISPAPLYYLDGIRQKSLLQEHFSLMLMYFVPVYWLLNWLTGSYTLIIIQVTLILCSAWAIYRLIKLKTNDDWLAVISVLYYFLLQGHYSSFSLDCNICTMAFSLIPIFLLWFELKRYWAALMLLLLIFFSREETPLVFIFIFITLIIWHWKEKKVVGYCIAGILISIVYFIMLFKVFIPMVETKDVHYGLFQYSALGATPWEAFLYCIEHPINTFKLLYENPLPDHSLDGVKKELYMVYFISGGFLLFIRPQYLIWFIPILAQKMFNDISTRWGIMGYYADPIVSLFPISVFLTISVFKSKWVRYSLSVVVCVLALSVTWYKMNSNNRAINWEDTTKDNVFAPNFFHPDYDAAKIHADLKLIPSDAKVCASESILPHLTERKYAYNFPDVEDAEYLALFTFKDCVGLNDSSYSAMLSHYILSPFWKVIAYDPPLLLMKKSNQELKNMNLLDSLECGAETLSADKLHFVASNGELVNGVSARDSLIKRTGKYSIRINKNNQYGFGYYGKNLKSGDLLKVSVWEYPVYHDTGRLIVDGGKDFYKTTLGVNEKDNKGWGELILYVTVPKDHDNLVIYTWNATSADVWFDDLKIVRWSIK
jgi:uncharacterized membrane protein